MLRECLAESRRADCMLVIGTSATVYPAAGFPLEVAERGGEVIEVNPLPSDLSPVASLSLRGPAGSVTSRLQHHLAEAPRERAHG